MKIKYEGESWMPETLKMGDFVFTKGNELEVPDSIGEGILAKPIAKERKLKKVPVKSSGKKEE